MKRILVASVVVLLSCGGNDGGVIPPSTLPTPKPSITPFGGKLSLDGHRFRNALGQYPELFGATVCCEEYPQNGWPLVTDAFLSDMEKGTVTATHIRTGPFIEYGQYKFGAYEVDPGTGLFDLTKVNPELISLVSDTVAAARARNIYVQVSLYDYWLMFNCEHSAHDGLVNLQHYRGCDRKCDILNKGFNEYQQIWIGAMVDATKNFDNVIYEVGNEAFRCKNAKIWEDDVIRFIHEKAPGSLVGSNIEAFESDYTTYHASIAPLPENKPVIVNEYDRDLTPETVAFQMEQAYHNGTYFWYWRGSHGREDWLRTLAEIKKIQR